ncbi:Uncharacterised protein [Enterobacter cloacae]|nr:Uncharacterised protein [Enterobacter cloacae]
MVGFTGASVSMVTVQLLLLDSLPIGSFAVAVKVWSPRPRSTLGVKLQVPSAPAVVVPSTLLPSMMVTVLPAFAVPLICGRVSSVSAPCDRLPVTLPVSSVTAVISTLPGTTSTVMTTCEPSGPVLPDGSVTVVVRSCAPFASGWSGV